LYSYDEIRSTHPTAHELGRIFQFVATLALLELLAESLGLTVIFRPSTARVVTFWVFAVVLIAILRAGARVFVRRMPAYEQRVVIIGSGPKVDRLVDVLSRDRRFGMQVVGRIWTTDRGDDRHLVLTTEALPELAKGIRRMRPDRVIVVDDAGLRWDLETTVRGLYGLGVIIDIVPQVSEMFSMLIEMHDIEGTPLLAIPHPRMSRGAAVTKRSFDLVIGGMLMLALAPMVIAVAWAIRRDSDGPVFYRQTRIGKHGREFGMFKFRTMIDGADSHRQALREIAATGNGNGASLFKVENDPRVTRVGRFLRRHSLDELPQLINVLIGQMSLVGPRPLIPEEDMQVSGWGMRRTAIPPGMTGLWQVSGSNDIAFAEMVGLDYSYVSSWSIWGDVRVMLQTIPVVVGGSRVDR
jgi:exopolysaccharide biosynthesis polyprenyl glycosylphosphotransferase